MAIVALSIEPFAATQKLPALVAKELGLTFFDLAPLERAIAERLFTNRRDALIDFGPAVTDRRWSMTVIDLGARLRELVLETALQGDVLIHGWTAVPILSNLPHVATIRLHASKMYRGLEVQKYKKYPLLDCAALDLASDDDLAARLLANLLGEPPICNAPADLVVDTELVSEQNCFAMVAALFAERLYIKRANAEAEINGLLSALR